MRDLEALAIEAHTARIKAIRENMEAELASLDDKLKRQLSIEIGEAVIKHAEAGLSPEKIVTVLEEHYAQERRLLKARERNERAY